jgi:hypothetical protein
MGNQRRNKNMQLEFVSYERRLDVWYTHALISKRAFSTKVAIGAEEKTKKTDTLAYAGGYEAAPSSAARCCRLAFLAALAAAAFAFFASAFASCQAGQKFRRLSPGKRLVAYLLLLSVKLGIPLLLLLFLLRSCARRAGAAPHSVQVIALLGFAAGFFFLLDALDTRVEGEGQVDERAQTRSVFLFSACTLSLVLFLCIPFIVSAE